MSNENILEEKLRAIGMDPRMGVVGLQNLAPINYWDYTQVDTLLTLQKPRTEFEDEYIFIVYHQITELVFNLMLHELKQLTGYVELSAEKMTVKLKRLSNYTNMLQNSFDIMTRGMDYDQYNTFRHSLAPASGFQSAQYRMIELYCTSLKNLARNAPENATIVEQFQHIYWQHAGTDPRTGNKTLTLRQFEEKYLNSFIETAHLLKDNTLENKLQKIQESGNLTDELRNAAREFDQLYNVTWPLVHLQTARFYLNAKGENKAATGGSEWQKYLHPKYQRRIFFPSLWSDIELAHWGEE
ncbi:MAG: tryptophan 2,3-dioxygenase [Bacteroidetes bacterium]|nr:tryptophan 2,3-dioxygenase [Bacteroidota bacterium]